MFNLFGCYFFSVRHCSAWRNPTRIYLRLFNLGCLMIKFKSQRGIGFSSALKRSHQRPASVLKAFDDRLGVCSIIFNSQLGKEKRFMPLSIIQFMFAHPLKMNDRHVPHCFSLPQIFSVPHESAKFSKPPFSLYV